MMDTVKFRCDVTPTGHTEETTGLVFGVNLNGTTKFVSFIDQTTTVEIDIVDEDDAEQTIEFVLQGKTSDHTKLDSNNNVVSDAMLIINNISVDGIDIDSIVLTNSLPYKHSFNGNSEEIVDKFYDTMGCNGTVTLKFTTPFYMWLLENM